MTGAGVVGRGPCLSFFRQSESAGVPGRHITDRQMRLFITLRKTHNTEIAAAKSGFSRATGYRCARDPFLSERNAAPRGRRRPDPLVDICEAEVVPILEATGWLWAAHGRCCAPASDRASPEAHRRRDPPATARTDPPPTPAPEHATSYPPSAGGAVPLLTSQPACPCKGTGQS